MAVERLWTEEEMIDMTRAFTSLRRMRTAASMLKPPRLLRLLRAPLVPHQVALEEAKDLADAAADFFVASIKKLPQKPGRESRLKSLLKHAETRYAVYQPATYAQTGRLEVVGNYIWRFRNLHIDPEYMLQWDLCRYNNLGGITIDEVIQQNLGVLAPLTGDYLLASTYRAYLRDSGRGVLSVHPVALSKDLHSGNLQTKNRLPFEEKTRIGIFLDISETGNTARAVEELARQAYPRKQILDPKITREEFIPSERINAFWRN